MYVRMEKKASGRNKRLIDVDEHALLTRPFSLVRRRPSRRRGNACTATVSPTWLSVAGVVFAVSSGSRRKRTRSAPDENRTEKNATRERRVTTTRRRRRRRRRVCVRACGRRSCARLSRRALRWLRRLRRLRCRWRCRCWRRRHARTVGGARAPDRHPSRVPPVTRGTARRTRGVSRPNGFGIFFFFIFFATYDTVRCRATTDVFGVGTRSRRKIGQSGIYSAKLSEYKSILSPSRFVRPAANRSQYILISGVVRVLKGCIQ